MCDTHYEIGGIPLEYCEWEWPLFRGATPRQLEIPQRAARYEALAALPYKTDITLGSSYGDGVNPPEAACTIKGVRVCEVRRVGELGCTLVLSDCRWDLKNAVCPRDFNLRFRDGYLDGTGKSTILDALQKLADALPVLKENLAPDAYEYLPAQLEELPDGIVLSGMLAPLAIDKLCALVGVDMTVGLDGLIRFVGRSDIGGSSIPPLGAYKWMLGGEPTWLTTSRTIKGLPRTVRVHYRERHALRVEFNTGDSTVAGGVEPALRITLTQRYFYKDKDYTLQGLLTALGFATDTLTEEQIARVIFTQNFEGTPLDRFAGSVQALTLIKVIKECWRRRYLLNFESAIGRMGGWTDIVGGKIRTDADKDNNATPAGDIDARAIEASWVEILGGAIANYAGDQKTIINATVALTHDEVPSGNTLPNAPFIATINEATGIVELSPSTDVPDGSEAHLGSFTPDRIIRVGPTDTIKNDMGESEKAEFNFRWPTPERLALSRNFQMFVFMAAIRRLPNTAGKWTTIDVDGVSGGDVEVVELEVGDELFALRDYVGPNKPAQGDGLGLVLNAAALATDAKRRAAAYLREAYQALEGKALALGCPLCVDLIPHGSIRELKLEVSGLRVRSSIELGNLGDAEARARRSQARESRNVIISGERRAV